MKTGKPDLNLVSQGCKHEKRENFTSRIRTQDPCISYKYFDIGPSKPDTEGFHSAAHVKIPIERTNLPNQ
jgi:hypothetical protein